MMKKINISQKHQTILDERPLIAVIGNHEPYKSKTINDLLSNIDFYSKKFGRIIYVGEKKYKSPMIVQDQSNWRENASYSEIMDFLDEAKKDGIHNILFVINPKNIKDYEDIFDKLMGIRFTYLSGIISLMICMSSPLDVRKETLSKFTNVFYTDSDEYAKIADVFKVKTEQTEKRKKDIYIFGEGKVEIYKEIKD